jgi:cell shape-determining protein MreC
MIHFPVWTHHKKYRQHLLQVSTMVVVSLALMLTFIYSTQVKVLLSPILFSIQEYPKLMLKSIDEVAEIASENARLEVRVAELENQVRQQQQILGQVQLGNELPTVFTPSSAALLFGVQGERVINKGSKEGIRTGDAVFSAGRLIGVVQDVKQTSSLVKLIGTEDLIIQVVSEQESTGILRYHGNTLWVENISSSQAPAENEVFFSFLDQHSNIPQGLFVGKVKKVHTQPQSSTVTAELDTDLNQLILLVNILSTTEE